MNQTISLLGCGWLGKALAEHLIASGRHVKGSTTTYGKPEQMKRKGIEPYLINLDSLPEPMIMEAFLTCAVLVINVPPAIKKSSPHNHARQLMNLCSKYGHAFPEKLIYISSASVYPERGIQAYETSVKCISEASNQTLFKAEQFLCDQSAFQTIVLRCSGLAGGDRIPGKKSLLSGKTVKANTPVNMVHREDVIRAINLLLDQKEFQGIYNLSAPVKPLRINYYERICNVHGLPAPRFHFNSHPASKFINASLFSQHYHFTYNYPDPLYFF